MQMSQTAPTDITEARHACRHPEDALEILAETRDYITGHPFRIAHCHACNLDVTVPAPSETEIGAYYPTTYYGTGNRFTGGVEWFLDTLYGLRADRITRMRPPGKVLDVGCGRGLLLNKLRERGWDVSGTELSDEAAVYARERLGIPVRTGSLLNANFPAEEFDLVLLWHVLEHLHDPRAVLAEIARILKPGGGLLVAVPNLSSWEARATGTHWFHLDVPRHLTHFTDRALREALQDAGFSIRQAGYFSAEFDFFSFIQSAQNALGLHHNLLYNLLRTRSAKVVERGIRPFWYWPVHLCFTATTLPMLAAASVGYAPLAAVPGEGATVSFYAVKEVT